MGERVRLCASAEVPAGTARRFDIGEHRIALIRVGDSFYALGDRCSHADYSLSEGEVFGEDLEIECWKHGSTFSLETGDLLALPTWKRAQAGMFLVPQYPTEVPGVSLEDALGEALTAAGRDRAEVPELVAAEAGRIGFDPRFIERPLNVDLSGGEKKRNET